ncbi:MAG: hypothetical protein A2Y15_01095 [Clostridiales bacterium GWF2_36_10]|nr:MAG: hypothetical protein A2Y15_01095 [Clostridiales bacterium GWF2_36_10]HAN20544.1 hypothetical protein [Clostridiales bacterium]
MNRGIFLETKDSIKNNLLAIFEEIDLNDKWVYIQEDQAYSADNNESFFHKDIYSGFEFKELISSPHFIIFLNLSIFPNQISIKQNDSYNDYCKSESLLTLFCTDCCYYEIYIKDQSMIYKLFEFYKKLDCDEIEIITDENDGRTRFSVW